MRKLVSLAALAAALAVPAAARAQLVLGARTGWAVPGGQLVSGRDLSATVSGALPVQLEAGWRFAGALTVGAYASYAVARIDTYLDNLYEVEGESTGGSVLRAGLRAEYALDGPSAAVAPWGAIGAGWTRAAFDVGSEFVYTGFDLAVLELGADWKATPALRAGPFVSWTLGRYRTFDVSGGSSGTIDAQANHAWVTFGLRGTWGG